MSELQTKQRKISINELPVELPDFTDSYEPKDSLIKKWIINWILSSVKKKQIKENDILPSKSEISDYLGVSVGTVQNAIRYVEDTGLLKSKQKLGTMIANSNEASLNIKSTSKRDIAIYSVKRLIIQKGYAVGATLPSARQVADYLNISQNTARLAYENLLDSGIIATKQIRSNDTNWYLKKVPQLSKEQLKALEKFYPETLVDKITDLLKNYLAKNFAVGDKIPTHDVLAANLNVSVKTINDAIGNLNKEGIIITRRGRYGSILAQNPLNAKLSPLKENSIFAKAEDAAFYSYQKTEEKIIKLINENYSAGDKLPSMQDLARKFDVSTNTIRKALINIAQDGYITFSRGRFGGTYVVEKPSATTDTPYQWISINPDFI